MTFFVNHMVIFPLFVVSLVCYYGRNLLKHTFILCTTLKNTILCISLKGKILCTFSKNEMLCITSKNEKLCRPAKKGFLDTCEKGRFRVICIGWRKPGVEGAHPIRTMTLFSRFVNPLRIRHPSPHAFSVFFLCRLPRDSRRRLRA